MATVTPTNENFFQQAVNVWASAANSGLKMQTEYANWLQQTYGNSDSLAGWYKESQAAVSETIAKAQESLDETLKVIQQQAQSSVKLMQPFEAQQGANDSHAQQNYREWWKTAVEALQANSQVVLKANSHLLKDWSELSQKLNSKATEAMASLAQKTTEQAQAMTNSATEHVMKMAKQASEN